MFAEIKKEFNLLRILILLLIITLSIHLFQIFSSLLQNFSDIIVILVISWLLSFALEPIVEKISKTLRIPIIFSTIISYVLLAVFFTIIILLFIPVITVQIQALAKVFPDLVASAPPFISKYAENFTSSFANAITVIPSVAQFLASVFIVLIISFYFIIDKERINKEIYILTPEKWHNQLRFIQKVIKETFASFLRVQLIFGIINGFITWFILQILGIEFAAAIGVLAGIFTLIPLVGPLLALIPPLFIAFVTDPAKGIIVFAVLFVAQQIIFNIWGPRLMGKTFNLHPLIILISFFVGFKIAGGMGAIFAIPLISITTVVLKDLGHHFLSPNRKT